MCMHCQLWSLGWNFWWNVRLCVDALDAMLYYEENSPWIFEKTEITSEILWIYIYECAREFKLIVREKKIYLER